jgi:ubiquitin C-terminal hydrolase
MELSSPHHPLQHLPRNSRLFPESAQHFRLRATLENDAFQCGEPARSLFGTRSEITITCQTCKQVLTREFMISNTTVCHPRNSDSTIDVLSDLNHNTTITGFEKPCAPGCNVASRHLLQQRHFISLPPYFILRVNRSHYDITTHTNHKDIRPVTAPLIATFRQFPTVNQPARFQYNIIAYASHHGISLNSGHYTADCFRDGQWWRLDDSTSMPLPTNSPDTTSAVVLIYSKY